MTDEFPNAGQVFEYRYLWKWQADAGETEGRKTRPSCVTVVVTNGNDQTVIFIAPITSAAPGRDRLALTIPEFEAKRAKLDHHIPLWIIVDELNVDVLETSYTLEDRTPRGAFSPAFTDLVVRSVQSVRQTGSLKLSKRT